VGNAVFKDSGVLIHAAVGMGVLVSVGVLETEEEICKDVLVGVVISVGAFVEEVDAQAVMTVNESIT